MRPQTAKRLLDARNADLEITAFTSGKIVDDMWNDRTLRLSLHKVLEIVGEALNQASTFDPDTASHIPNLRRSVDIRHQITHGYDSVDDAIVRQAGKSASRQVGKSRPSGFHRWVPCWTPC